MKLSEYAKQNGVTYVTAYHWFKSGIIKGKQLSNKTIIIDETENKINHIYDNDNSKTVNNCIIYARVSTSEQKEHIDKQLDRLRDYAHKNGYVILKEYKEIASGLNENRPLLNKILDNNDFNILIVEHKDRLTRFGFNYIEKILTNKNQSIQIINHSEQENDIIQDFISIITCFCSKIYGQRGHKNKTEKILKVINEE